MAKVDFFDESFCEGKVLGTRERAGVLGLFDFFGVRIQLNCWWF